MDKTRRSLCNLRETLGRAGSRAAEGVAGGGAGGSSQSGPVRRAHVSPLCLACALPGSPFCFPCVSGKLFSRGGRNPPEVHRRRGGVSKENWHLAHNRRKCVCVVCTCVYQSAWMTFHFQRPCRHENLHLHELLEFLNGDICPRPLIPDTHCILCFPWPTGIEQRPYLHRSYDQPGQNKGETCCSVRLFLKGLLSGPAGRAQAGREGAGRQGGHGLAGRGRAGRGGGRPAWRAQAGREGAGRQGRGGRAGGGGGRWGRGAGRPAGRGRAGRRGRGPGAGCTAAKLRAFRQGQSPSQPQLWSQRLQDGLPTLPWWLPVICFPQICFWGQEGSGFRPF